MDKIGIKICKRKPKNIERTNEVINHCAMIAKARKGRIFYAQPEDYKCALARFNLGLQKRVKAFQNSVVRCLISHGHAKDEETATKCLESKKKLKVERKYLIYFPLYKKILEPDLIVLIGLPEEIMNIVHKISKDSGKAISACMSGTSAMCGEITAYPLVTSEPNISLGCCGSRNFGELKREEMVMGIPLKGRYGKYVF
jgi:uncharacterized protein (DUF169 family)